MFRCVIAMTFLIFLGASSLSFAAPVKTGAQILAGEDFSPLRGKKFALVTNHTAVVDGIHLMDLMIKAQVPPAVVFTPEHGLKGTAEDGIHIGNGTCDGIPVRSLYGSAKKPKQEDLKDIDLVVFDIQDVGVRFYTYISTMGLVMEAAAEKGIPFMVLDRPNPLGGNYVAGFVRKELPATFTSFYPIPVAHGMTVGEMALMIKGAGMLPGLAQLEIIVVRMEGWQRWMRWPDTGLTWLPTSPNIPDFESALLYPGIGLLEATNASEGRGTDRPFRLAGIPGLDRAAVAKKLNRQELAGIHFDAVQFTPLSLPGKSSLPKQMNKTVDGVELVIDDYLAVQPVEVGIAVVSELYDGLSPAERRTFFRHGFEDMAGSNLARQAVEEGKSPEEITHLWAEEIADFLQLRKNYLLYVDEPTRQI
ncbi:exo-beta-N-acetylmuramidase NamZ family protein [Geotalea daltonii]|uniref:exo-beta-N-acetylmuramidase NamZ family protein n=1 Tax=Geotalea daltonii TaxID=1203471 RepID=UPI0002EE5096|nr:exo-beta-N-acetylmuramidase NamZ domain-containing protein [Geotalea daltonii]